MKVLFFEVDTDTAWGVASFGPGYLAPFLRRAGHEVAFFRATLAMTPEDVAERVRQAAPDLIGLSLTTRQWLRARELVRAVRAVHDVPVVTGGLHPTFSPEQVLATPGFDYVCLGEGELAMLDLVEALAHGRPADGILNIGVRGAPRPKLRPPIEPLDALPFIERDLLDEYAGVVHLSTQRGCPFPCTYCAARKYEDLYDVKGQSYGRRRSLGSVMKELHALDAVTPLRWVSILDDTFTIHHPWVKEFCRAYRDEIHVDFGILARVETVNEGMLHELAAAGCKLITYGVESGSERVRRKIMDRPVTNQRFRDVIRWTKEAGIKSVANYMLGLPGETREDVEATLALADELPTFDLCYYVFYPYPGTQLFHVCQEQGVLPPNFEELPATHRQSVLRLRDLTPEDIAELYDRFTAIRERRCLARRPGATEGEKTEILADVHRYATTN